MEYQIKVVVVDDNTCMLLGLRHLIDAQSPAMGVVDTVSRSCDVASSVVKHRPDVVLLDMDMEGQESIQLVTVIKQNCTARMIVLVGTRDAALQEKAILAGAHGLVTKAEPGDTLVRAIKAVHGGELWLKRDMTAKILGMMAAAYQQQSTKCVSESQFTPSENRVIAAAVKYRGAPNKVIADMLNMSPNTFRNHLSSIYLKLGIHRRLDLVLFGMKHVAEGHAETDASGSELIGTPYTPVAGGHTESDELRSSLETKVLPRERRDPAGALAGSALGVQTGTFASGTISRMPSARLVRLSSRSVGTAVGRR